MKYHILCQVESSGYAYKDFWIISEKVDRILRIQGVKESSEMLINYKDLKVWQKSYQLCLDIYKITKGFPKEERYSLIKKVQKDIAEVERMLKALINPNVA